MSPLERVAILASTSSRPYFLRRRRTAASASAPDTGTALPPRAHSPLTAPLNVHAATAAAGLAARRLALPVRLRVRKYAAPASDTTKHTGVLTPRPLDRYVSRLIHFSARPTPGMPPAPSLTPPARPAPI